jgi:gliding motility-associated peptidyl-prolyl isomerase
MIFVIRAVCVLIFCSLCKCSGSQNRREWIKGSELPRETSIELNKRLVGEEQKTIEEYVKDNKLVMQRTETGLWYSISNEGTGENVKKGKIVTMNYSVRLINGSLLYSSEETGSKEFLVGQGGVETGLEEGILLLKSGSKALFIMPSYMAHGLIGDDDKIPARAALLYEVEVIKIRD